jgi:hypothetical protein
MTVWHPLPQSNMRQQVLSRYMNGSRLLDGLKVMDVWRIR